MNIIPMRAESTPANADTSAGPALFITDIDGTLLHEGTGTNQPGLDLLKERLARRQGRFLWGVATGRRLELIRQAFATHQLPDPDVIIASVGTEIHLDLQGTQPDTGWQAHLDHRWDAAAVRSTVSAVPGLTPQKPASQGRFKVSFEVDGRTFQKDQLMAALGSLCPDVNVFITRGTHLDVLPRRASKWHAIEFFCTRQGIPLSQLVVAGDSGNDLDMLARSPRGIVVGNHSSELIPLRGHAEAYFSPHPATLGILDGLDHFQFPTLT